MLMYRVSGVLAAGLVVGLVAAGCSRTAEAPPAATTASATAEAGASSAAQAPPGGGDLVALVPTPANTTSTKGPDPIADNGIHRYFKIDGKPMEVMDAYRTALEGKGWKVSTLSSSEDEDGGGATLAGNNGEVYGVFDGGGYMSTTFLEVCTWPTKPADPSCRHGNDR